MANDKNFLHKQWEFFNRLPFGKFLFSFFVNRYIPYTGSMSSRVVELKPGYSKVTLRDRRKVRNHLHSVHAIALANLVEFTGNLAVACGLPADARFIPKRISVDYLKKARGLLTAESQTPIITSNERREIEVMVEIKDREGDLVATGQIKTLIGPKK
jgi:acyl-coenzyme A thioesterase PaaI-like protein